MFNKKIALLSLTTVCAFSMESSETLESLREQHYSLLEKMQLSEDLNEEDTQTLQEIHQKIIAMDSNPQRSMDYDNRFITIGEKIFIIKPTSGEDNHCFLRAITHDKAVDVLFDSIIPPELPNIFSKQGQSLENGKWQMIREFAMNVIKSNLDTTFDIFHPDIPEGVSKITVGDYIYRYCQLASLTHDDKTHFGKDLFIKEWINFYKQPKAELSTEFSVILPLICPGIPNINIYDITPPTNGSHEFTGKLHERVGRVITRNDIADSSLKIAFDANQGHFYALEEIV